MTGKQNEKLRLLLIAPTIDRTDVGEAWSAYQWASRLSGSGHDLTVLTYHKRDRPAPSTQLPDARVIEWRDLPAIGRFERVNSMLKPGYVAFHSRARRWIKQALARGEHFDVAHQVAPLAVRYPSPAAGLGIPLIMGPVGGSLTNPPGFDSGNDTAPWYVALRRLDRARMRRDPLLTRTYREAARILVIAPYVLELIGSSTTHEVMSDTALESLPPAIDRSERTDDDGKVRLLYVGRIVRTKGLRYAIAAMAQLRTERTYHLDVVGDGFDRAFCERLAGELGVDDRITFHGRVPRHEVDRFYRQAEIFVFPSYREPGGNVVFEALAHSLAVITCDRGGPGATVTDECAVKLLVRSPEQLIEDLGRAVDMLIDDEAQRRQLGERGRDHVARTAMWDAKIERAIEIYRELAGPDSQSLIARP